MNFWANSLQPVAGATGIVSRVQLPVAGRVSSSFVGADKGRALPAIGALAGREQLRSGVAAPRGQHRAQCRANCMSKANF